MKKLLFFLAACAVSLSTFAAITPAKSTLDFGTVSIKGLSDVEGDLKLNVSWTGLVQYAHVFVEFQNEPAEGCGFFVDTDDLITEGSGHPKITEYEYTVSFLADKAGTYTCKMYIYAQNTSYDYDEAYVDLKVVVTDEAIVAQVVPFERIEKTSDLHDGDTIIFVNEAAGAVSDCADGLKNSTSLTAITDNVIVNTTTHKATVPDNAVFLKLSKYGDYWQLINVKTSEKLLLDIGNAEGTGKGAFSYTEQTGVHLANWSIDITNGVATVGRLHDDDYDSELDWSFLVRYMNGGSGMLFKPYRTGSDGSSICIYKKTGNAAEKQSSLTINPTTIDFGTVAYKSTKEIEISYTAENLEDVIIWDMAGTDAAKFQIIEDSENTKTSGKLTLKYLGTATSAAALSAQLTYTTLDAKLDYMEDAFDVSINLIKLDGISFSRSSYDALINTSLDLSQELTFDPNTVPSTGRQVTWKIENSYSGAATITAAGVFSATTSRTYTVTATSTIGDNITASCDIEVLLPAAESITLSKTDTTMHKGDYFTLGATVNPDGAAQAVTYSSDNTDVATFNNSGKITAKGYGNATITVTANSDANIKATCTVHVVPWAVESVEFDPDVITVYTGTQVKLEPTILPTKAIDENDVIFESDDNNTAPVVDSCYVRGDQVGSATITVTAGTLTATLQVNVVNPPYFIKVTTPAILQEKDTIILAADLGGGSTVIAGARNNKKLTAITDGLVDDPYAYAVDAQRFVIGTISGKTGYTLARPNATKVLAESGNDLYEENTTTSKNIMWEFVEDGTNGVYVHNLGNTNAYFKYLNNAIKPYKSTSEGAVYVYVYRRQYKAPTAVENIEVEAVPAQKMLHEGRIVIIREGVMYELDGRRTK